MTLNLDFAKKLYILRSALSTKGSHWDRSSTIRKIKAISELRNTIAHNVFGPEAGGGVQFLTAEARSSVKFPETVLSAQRFVDLNAEMRELRDEMISLADELARPSRNVLAAILADMNAPTS